MTAHLRGNGPLVLKGALTSATPGQSGMFVIAVPTVSRPVDLSEAHYTKLREAIVAGKLLSITADFDLWYRWGAESGDVDETKTAEDTPLSQAESLYASERLPPRCAPGSATWLMVKGEADTFLRITIVE